MSLWFEVGVGTGMSIFAGCWLLDATGEELPKLVGTGKEEAETRDGRGSTGDVFGIAILARSLVGLGCEGKVVG